MQCGDESKIDEYLTRVAPAVKTAAELALESASSERVDPTYKHPVRELKDQQAQTEQAEESKPTIPSRPEVKTVATQRDYPISFTTPKFHRIGQKR